MSKVQFSGCQEAEAPDHLIRRTGLGEGVAKYVRINAPVACPQCGLLLLLGDSFKVPDAGLIPELAPATKT
jgi:hypothetical protein